MALLCTPYKVKRLLYAAGILPEPPMSVPNPGKLFAPTPPLDPPEEYLELIRLASAGLPTGFEMVRALSGGPIPCPMIVIPASRSKSARSKLFLFIKEGPGYSFSRCHN